MKVDAQDTITGGSLYTFAPLPATAATQFRSLVDDTFVTKRKYEDLGDPVRESHRTALKLDLEQRTSDRAKLAPRDGLNALGDLGFAWRNVAALMGVSVAAVNKWRRGEGITGPNRLKLARILALLDVLETHMIAEPASWLEMPIHDGVNLTPIDMLVANRYDLVLEFAAYAIAGGDHQTILDEFDPDWRNSLVDKNFETFVDADGIVAIRPKASI
ncbi:transcriptional regulator [Rhodococcus sp. NPDC060176]|uniref:transcriptional regulator n=1 Tax=Rhodococcus sp. NPDC060176 TaxID=3347062 RepID=UPI00365337C7